MVEIKDNDGELLYTSKDARNEWEALTEAMVNGHNGFAGAHLRLEDLSGIDLAGADLSGADFCSADLRGANLRGANLCGADLYMADLSRADLRGAFFEGATLAGTKLDGAFGVSKEMDDWTELGSPYYPEDSEHREEA